VHFHEMDSIGHHQVILDFSFIIIFFGNDITVDPEKFFNANFAKKNVFHEKYLKPFV